MELNPAEHVGYQVNQNEKNIPLYKTMIRKVKFFMDE
jgi:hypothetical protein